MINEDFIICHGMVSMPYNNTGEFNNGRQLQTLCALEPSAHSFS